MRTFLFLLFLAAWVEAGEQHRILVVGDSWAALMNSEGSLQAMFDDNGRPDLVVHWEETALGGTTAAQWANQELDLISEVLESSPNLLVAQITMGGNDFLAGLENGGWWQGMPVSAEMALFDQILNDSVKVVDHILNQRPEMQILISLYDYLNLVDINCDGLSANLGSPTTAQLNAAFGRVEARFAALAQSRDNVNFVSHAGLMQVTFGYAPAGIEPGSLTLPGDPNLPSPASAMADCIHLTTQGYRVLAQNLWDGFYSTLGADGGDPAATNRWLPHVTRSDGGFSSVITAYNRGSAGGDVTLTAFSTTGANLAALSLSPAPGTFTRMSLSELFQGEVSHIAITGSDQIDLTLAYKANGLGASAHVNESSRSGKRWLLYPGETDVVFDGLAILNADNQTTAVRLQQIDANGTEIGSAVVTEDLGPLAKQLVVLADWFSDYQNHAIVVSTDQPVYLVALRGSLGGATPAYLYQTVPILLE